MGYIPNNRGGNWILGYRRSPLMLYFRQTRVKELAFDSKQPMEAFWSKILVLNVRHLGLKYFAALLASFFRFPR